MESVVRNELERTNETTINSLERAGYIVYDFDGHLQVRPDDELVQAC